MCSGETVHVFKCIRVEKLACPSVSFWDFVSDPRVCFVWENKELKELNMEVSLNTCPHSGAFIWLIAIHVNCVNFFSKDTPVPAHKGTYMISPMWFSWLPVATSRSEMTVCNCKCMQKKKNHWNGCKALAVFMPLHALVGLWGQAGEWKMTDSFFPSRTWSFRRQQGSKW